MRRPPPCAHPLSPHVASAQGHQVCLASASPHGGCLHTVTCCELIAPVEWLRWAPSDRLLLLAVDSTGATAIVGQPSAFLHPGCISRFPTMGHPLCAVEWLPSASGYGATPHLQLPLGIEGFAVVDTCGNIGFHWRRSFGADAADAARIHANHDAGGAANTSGWSTVLGGTCLVDDPTTRRLAISDPRCHFCVDGHWQWFGWTVSALILVTCYLDFFSGPCLLVDTASF